MLNIKAKPGEVRLLVVQNVQEKSTPKMDQTKAIRIGKLHEKMTFISMEISRVSQDDLKALLRKYMCFLGVMSRCLGWVDLEVKYHKFYINPNAKLVKQKLGGLTPIDNLKCKPR